VPVSWLLQSGQTLLDLLLPPRCLHCESAGSWFCATCVSQISFIAPPVCQRCGTPIDTKTSTCKQCKNNPLNSIDGIRVVAYFENNPIRSAIHFLKYKNHKAVASALADLLANAYRQYALDLDVIVPVPLHVSRFKERGYNQSELLVKQLGNLLKLPTNVKTLQRTRKTQSQMELGAEERHKNVASAFGCSDTELANKRVLLIDDVCTTGSTLDACAEALKINNAQSVWGLTLAKAH